MDRMREQFEAWECDADQGPQTDPVWLMYDPKTNTYPLDKIQGRWETWQASRAALVIELPAENPIGSGPGDCEGGLPSFEQHCAAECNFILRDCREAIKAAGLKVMP